MPDEIQSEDEGALETESAEESDGADAGEPEGGATQSAPSSWLAIGRIAAVAAMLVIFAITLAVRWGHLEDPMGRFHEEGTALALITSEVWSEDGPSPAGYLLRVNQSNPGDRHLAAGPSVDDEGNQYYLSLPPGHSLWMFLAHGFGAIEETILSVRVVNLMLHFLSALLVYLIVREMLNRLPDGWSRFAGLVAFAIYVSAPVSMWFQSNAYTSGSAVLPFFLAAIWAATRAYRKTGEGSRLDYRFFAVLAGVFTLLMAYTEWLGLAFAATIAVIAVGRRRDLVARWNGIAGAAGGALGLGIFGLQYGALTGFGYVREQFTARYTARSGLDPGTVSIASRSAWEMLWGRAWTAMWPQAFALAGFFVWDRIAGRSGPRRFSAGDAPASVVLSLAFFPVFVHHFVLFGHTAVHNFDFLKTAAFLSIASGYLVGRLVARYSRRPEQERTFAVAGLALAGVLVFSVSTWYYVDTHPQVWAQMRELGAVVAANTEPDDVVFVYGPDTLPKKITDYYAGRTYVPWRGDTAAAAVLERAGGRQGVLFLLEADMTNVQYAWVARDGTVWGTPEEAAAASEETATGGSREDEDENGAVDE